MLARVDLQVHHGRRREVGRPLLPRVAAIQADVEPELGADARSAMTRYGPSGQEAFSSSPILPKIIA